MGKSAYLTVLVLALCATPTSADDRTGWSFSAGIGASQIKDKDNDETFDGNSFGFAAEIEYRFTEYFALGFGGFTLGRAEDMFNGVDTEIEVRGYDFFGRVIYPFSDTAEVFGRLGATNYFVDIDPGSVSIDDALFGNDATEFGLGVDFGRKKKMAMRIEGRYYSGGSDESGALILAGFNYLF